VDDATVLFVDLVGSTALYQALGNARAAALVSGVTDWIGSLCEAGGGVVVRRLGDGVLVVFEEGGAAFACAMQMHRRQNEHNNAQGNEQPLQFRIGIARGSITAAQDGVGEVINTATDLCKRCGPEQILTTDRALHQLSLTAFARFRNLGLMHVRGKSEPVEVFLVEWKNDAGRGLTTVRGDINGQDFYDSVPGAGIRLSWAGRQAQFVRARLPLVLGRHSKAHFEIDDPRVSREHARIFAHDDVLVLEDTSRYGTSVRFESSATVLTLRHQECVLHEDCEIAFGSAFDPQSLPTMRLNFL